MSKAAVEFRRGQLVAGLEAMRHMLHAAERSCDLLDPDDRDRLRSAAESIAGIEQRAWAVKQRAWAANQRQPANSPPVADSGVERVADSALAARLAAELREDDERMTPAPWVSCYGDEQIRSGDPDGFCIADIDHPRTHPEDGPGIARLRNNARATAEQLEAALAEVSRLEDRVQDHATVLDGTHDDDSNLSRERRSLRAEVARLTAQEVSLRARLDNQAGWLSRQAYGRSGEDVSQFAEIQKLRAEVERMRSVVAAVGGWRPEAFRRGVGDPRPSMAVTNLAVAFDDYRSSGSPVPEADPSEEGGGEVGEWPVVGIPVKVDLVVRTVSGIPIGHRSGGQVKVDLDAVRRSCEATIAHRPGDASIPRVVISADILLAMVSHAEQVRLAVADQSMHRSFIAEIIDQGPIVSGPGAADAAGEVAVDSRIRRHWMVRS